MKRRTIPQAEFAWGSEDFALAVETVKAAPVASAPTIMAEMTEAERQRLRDDETIRLAKLSELDALRIRPIAEKRQAIADRAATTEKEWREVGRAIRDEVKTMAGLAPGSHWGETFDGEASFSDDRE